MNAMLRRVRISALASVATTWLACSTSVPVTAAGSEPGYRQTAQFTQVVLKGNPSVFQAWSGIEDLSNEDELALVARHDLVFAHPWHPLQMNWLPDEHAPYEGFATRLDDAKMDIARARRSRLLELNPHLLILVSIDLREGRWVPKDEEGPGWWQKAYFPPDSPLWLRDGRGAPIPAWGEDTDGDGVVEPQEAYSMLVDFRKREVQDLIAAKALAVKESGLYHGIMFDWWNEASHGATTDAVGDGWAPVLTAAEEWEARLAILKKVRDLVGDDFLILVNANYRTIPGSAPYVNGIFMECWKDAFDRGYTRSEIRKIEDTLQWAEANLRQPRINCLEGWRVVSNYLSDRDARITERNSPVNLQWMRLFTTMSLTLSDGYVLFSDDNALPTPDHLHTWYDFWDIDLGPALSAKGVRYRGIEGLYLREFLRGWAVYNRSGRARTIEFDADVTRASSGASLRSHLVGDLDGDIFLKQ